MNHPQRSRTPEPPYCWQSKEALRRIREQLDGDSLLPFALCTYMALTENASDQGVEEFATLQGYLAHLAGGISTRTLRRILPLLRELGIIDYTTPRLRGPTTFRLLSVTTHGRDDRTNSPNVGTNSPNVRTGKFSAFQSYNRSNKEELLEEQREESLVGTREQQSSLPSSATRRAVSVAAVSAAGLDFADRFRATLPEKVSLVAGWREKWARTYDLLLRLDKREAAEIERVWQWARHDSFWSPQFQSPLKLRKRNREGVMFYDLFLARLNGTQPCRRRKDPPI